MQQRQNSRRYRAEDMIGQRFGTNTVVARVRGKVWLCRCDCGSERPLASDYLRKSPGCRQCNAARRAAQKAERAANLHKPTWNSWVAMRHRCNSGDTERHRNYAGRGITVCPRWDSYENFVSDMGERPEGTTLDRIDTDGDYTPSNCRWATPALQSRNRRVAIKVKIGGEARFAAEVAEQLGLTRAGIYHRLASESSADLLRPKRTARTITANGRSQTIVEWAKEVGVSPVTISTRLAAGWPEVKAVGNSPRQLRRRRRGA